MPKVLVIVPAALDEEGVANRRQQLTSVRLGPDIDFDYRAVKAGPLSVNHSAGAPSACTACSAA